MGHFQQKLLHLAIHSLTRVFDSIETADAVLDQVCLYRWPRAVLLDTMLGPAEDVDYVSRTAPATAPPTI